MLDSTNPTFYTLPSAPQALISDILKPLSDSTHALPRIPKTPRSRNWETARRGLSLQIGTTRIIKPECQREHATTNMAGLCCLKLGRPDLRSRRSFSCFQSSAILLNITSSENFATDPDQGLKLLWASAFRNPFTRICLFRFRAVVRLGGTVAT